MIVPFFQNERTIGRCLDALLAQTVDSSDVELLFVDNNSSDRSREIVEGCSTSAAVTLLSEAKAGAYAARNAALDIASGDIVAFTDADCCPDKDWLETIVAAMTAPDVGVVVGHCRYPSEASLVLRWLERYENAKSEFVVNTCPPDYRFVYANNMAVRGAVFDSLGSFVEWARAGDTELVHRMAREQPEQRVVYDERMRVTHLEFERARDRLRRLRTYTGTNQQIDSFRELSWVQRLRVLGRSIV